MLETIVCAHKETVRGVPGGIQQATCTLCGQTRRFKDTDEESVVITKLGRIDGKVVIPKAGIRFAITPEETRWFNEGRDMMRKKEEEAEFQEKMGAMKAKASTPVPTQIPEVEKKPLDSISEPEPSENIQKETASEVVAEPRKLPRMHSKRLAFCERHKKEMVADYYSMTLRAYFHKWRISAQTWIKLREIWSVKKKGHAGRTSTKQIKVPITKMGRPQTGKATHCIDCGVELYIAKNRIREGKEYRCGRCRSRNAAKAPRRRITTPTVREEVGKTPKGQGKEFLRAADKIEITVGRLEELLREIEWLRGYRQAVLDIARIQENTAKE